MKPTYSYRYPGAVPFTREQESIFFGREKDTQALCRLVRLEKIAVLYSKSGLGKSSILNAGVIPQLEAYNSIVPLPIRFGAWHAAQTDMPTSTTRHVLLNTLPTGNDLLGRLVPEELSLWAAAKSWQWTQSGQRSLLLVFDQFEELFTYPEEDILAFQRELAELLRPDLPERLLPDFTIQGDRLTESEEDLLYTPLDVRLLLAIRADRLHLLDRLSNTLPGILRCNYELGALEEPAAIAAVIAPAAKEGEFRTPPFTYSTEAIRAIIDHLTENSLEKIETFQLQIICQHLERQVIENTGVQHIGIDDLGDLRQIFENYYADLVSRIGSPADQLAARKLIEEGLIFEDEYEKRRLNVYEGIIHRNYAISPALLRRLVDSHLLRAEPSLQGGYTYELSHDTLVGPVLKAKASRLAEEHREAEVLQEAERMRELSAERKKRRFATVVALVLGFLVLLLGLTTWFALQQYSHAQLTSEIAQQERSKAEQALHQFLEEEKKRKHAEALKHLQNARNYLLANEIDLARNELNTALQLDSSNVPVLQLLNSLPKN